MQTLFNGWEFLVLNPFAKSVSQSSQKLYNNAQYLNVQGQMSTVFCPISKCSLSNVDCPISILCCPLSDTDFP